MRLRARNPISSLNQKEWYMSNRSREVKTRSMVGLRALANLTAPSSWGINVPKMDAMARIIRSTRVSLSELKSPQIAFDRVSELDFFMSYMPKEKPAFDGLVRVLQISITRFCRKHFVYYYKSLKTASPIYPSKSLTISLLSCNKR